MAIKIQGSTIIDDSRKVINASHVGIGTTNPTVELDVDGQANISGIVTASSFVKSSNSGGFLKADGIEDTSTYLTTETQTLDDVVGLGSDTTQTITVGTATTGVVIRPDGTLKVSGIATAQKFVVEGGSSTGFLKADGSIDATPYATGTGTLDSIVVKDNSQNVGSASTFTSLDFYNGIGVSTTGVVGVASVRLEDNISISGIFTAASFSGSGSGLTSISTSALVGLATDADKLDGQQGSYYLNYSNFSGIATDSDKLDGIQASSFLRSDVADTKSSGDLTFSDSIKLNLGSGGQQDGSIYHDGTDTRFDNRTGDLILETIDTGEDGAGADIVIKAGTGKTSVLANVNGAVELWNNGSKKFETVGTGVSISSGTASTATIYGPGNLIIDPAPINNNGGIVRIKGDLYVDGTTTEINSTTLTIDDLNVVVASGATNGLTADGAGLSVAGAGATIKYNYNGGSEQWVFNKAPYYNTNRLLTTADEGSGNGLDADTLDGQQGTYYLNYSNFSGIATDSDKLDGQQGTYYLDYANFSGIATDSDKLDGQQGTYYLDYANFSGIATDSDKLDGQQGTYYLDYANFSGIATDSDKLDGQQGTYYLDYANFSGIATDSSLLSGIGSTSFLRSDAADIKTSGNLTFNDGINLQLGTSGSLKLYHNGSTSYIKNATGNLHIENQSNDGDIIIRTDDGSGSDTDYFRADGSSGEAILYHYGTQKLATKSNGIAVSGIVTASSGVVTYYGDGSQLTGINASGSPWITTGYTGIGTKSAVGIGTIIEVIPYDTQNGGTLSFEGSAGQLFSITNQLSSGSIFSVNDISGIPSIDVNADGTIQLAPVGAGESVGIGTTNPKYKLHVVGTTNIDGTFTVNGAPVQTGSGVASTITVADESSDTTCFPIFSTDATGNINPKTGSNLTFNSSTGVLTATGFSTTNGTSSQFLKADGSVDSSTYLTTETDPVVAAINGIVKSDGTTISTATAGTDYLTPSGDGSNLTGIATIGSRWITTGYTGIGTTSAVGIGTIIEVIPYDTQNNGTLSFEGSAGQLFSITNQLSSGSIFSVNDISGIPSIDVNADGTIQLAPVGAGESVGIGTTNPKYKLHVVGDTNIDGTFTVNGSPVSGSSSAAGSDGQIQYNNGGSFGGAAQLYYDDANNRVGIGSTLPTAKLDVDGTLNVTGISTFQNHVTLGDDDEIQFGDDNDAKIKVDTSQNFLLQGDGTTYLRGSTVIVGANGGAGGFETGIRVNEVSPETSQVELYYDNSLRLETIGAGVTVTGGLYVSGISTFQDDIEVTGNVEKYDTLVGSGSTTVVEFAVTVDTKSDHRYTGGVNGASTIGYYLDGIESPFLTLTPGRTYKFDQSDSSNNSHPLRFYLEADKTTQYTTNVTTNGTAGQAGAYTQIVVTDITPTVLHYQCSAHAYMGNAVFTNSNASSITGVTTDAQQNTYAGELAGGSFSGTSAQYNTLFGYDAGGDITTGDYNTCIGWTAGDKITEGTKNVALGAEALDFCTTGSNNVAVGWEAGRSLIGGTYNVMVGDAAGRTASSWVRTIAIGPSAASNHGTITDGIAIGNNALRNGGNYSIAIGYRAAYSQRNSEYSIYIGHQSGGQYTGTSPWGSGNENVAIGRNSLGNILDGADNTVLGANAGIGLTSGSNNILIGHDAAASSASASNEVVIGDLNITKFSIPGIGVTLKDNGGTPTQGHVLTVDANGEASFAAASGGGSSVWTTSGNDAYYTTGNIGIGTVSPVSDLDVRGLVTIQNLSGNNYNENLRLGRSNGGYSSIAFAANVANSSGTVAGQFTHLVYPSNTNFGDFAIRANSTDALRITTSGTPQLLNAGNKKLETRTDGIAVAGIVTAISGVVTYYGDASNLTNTTNASSGTYGSSTEAAQISVDSQGRITGITNVSIVSASNATPTVRTTHNFTTTDGQTLFPPTGTIGFTSSYVDVFYNGVRLEAAEYTENVTGSSGTSITLTTPAGLNDIVDIVAYESIGISTVNLLGDTTPQLGGDLDLNSNDITGTGNMNITGIATANGGQLQTEADVIAIAIALG